MTNNSRPRLPLDNLDPAERKIYSGLVDMFSEITEKRDRLILTLSTGTIGLSIAFTGAYQPRSWEELLIASWISLLLSVFGSLWILRSDAQLVRVFLKAFDADKGEKGKERPSVKKAYRSLGFAYLLQSWGFFIGVVLLLVFIAVNLLASSSDTTSIIKSFG